MSDHGDQGRPIRRGPYPELTWAAVFVGWGLGAIIAFAIGYAALILGFSIEGSELAAILGWGILRGIMGRTSIVENNINQTIASAVNGASSGMMFSVPALFILARNDPETYGKVTEFSAVLMVLACITGAIIGLAFIIPLRKQMIDFNRLAYPGGIAVAAILKSPGAGIKKAGLLLGGAVVSGGFYVVMLLTMGDNPDAPVGALLGLPTWLNLTVFLSLMTVGVGFLSGKGGMVFGYGGFICYWVLAPLLIFFGSPEVKEMIDVPPRTAIVEADNQDAVLASAEALESIDPEAAATLRSYFQLDIGRSLFDPEGVAILLNAHQLLTDEAKKPEAKESPATGDKAETDKVLPFGMIADELKDATRFDQIAEAIAATQSHPDLLAKLQEASTSKEVIEALKTQRNLDELGHQALLMATRAESSLDAVPNTLRTELFRPTGIGMLIGAAIAGIMVAFPLIRSAVRSMQLAAKETGRGRSDEMPIKLLYAGIFGGGVALTIIAYFSASEMTIWHAVAMAVLGTVWIWVAGVIVSECLGRTNWSPLSGMTLIAVTILILITGNLDTTSAVIGSVIVGAAICVAISQAGDMMLDLKSGYLVGAQPKMQQYAQYAGTWLGPILVIMLIFVLEKVKGLGTDDLPAPQGQALASVIQALIGGDVPAWRYAAGAGLGAMLAVSGLGGIGVLIGLGFYMPFNIVLIYTVGCLARIVVERVKGPIFVQNVGIPIAAGLIVGEALVGVGNAFYQVLFAG